MSRLSKKVFENDVLGFLKKKYDAPYVVEKLTPKIKDANYTSFKVGVPDQVKDIALEGSFWPKGVFVNRFFSKKKQVNFHKVQPPQTVR